MVRNEGGGNKMKHLARKHVNGSSQQQGNKFLRVSQCKEEIYAYIVRLLGNSMCIVKCFDGYERLCHIRGKFTGRSKRENALSQARQPKMIKRIFKNATFLRSIHLPNVKNSVSKKRYSKMS
jgi:hypothetical protein